MLDSFINFDELFELSDLLDHGPCFWNWSMNLLTLNIYVLK